MHHNVISGEVDGVALAKAQAAMQATFQGLENPHVSFYLSRCFDHFEEFTRLVDASVPEALASFASAGRARAHDRCDALILGVQSSAHVVSAC